MSDKLKNQLRAVITDYESALAKSRHSDASDVLTDAQASDLHMRCIAAIERASGRNSTYNRSVLELNKKVANIYYNLPRHIGVAKALLSDIENSYMESFEELLHGDVFGEFLEMAEHLLDKGYKDAAAVLAGSTLEMHIRNLCDKFGVTTTAGEKRRYKNTDGLNAELTKIGAYTKLDQKNIIAWLGLRNNAAHGNYAEYTNDQVRLLVASIRDFLTRHPA